MTRQMEVFQRYRDEIIEETEDFDFVNNLFNGIQKALKNGDFEIGRTYSNTKEIDFSYLYGSAVSNYRFREWKNLKNIEEEIDDIPCACSLNKEKADHIDVSKSKPCTPPSGDHLCIFRKNDGSLILVSQPYENEFSWNIEEEVEFAKKFNLDMNVSGKYSWHYPNKTLLVTYETK